MLFSLPKLRTILDTLPMQGAQTFFEEFRRTQDWNLGELKRSLGEFMMIFFPTSSSWKFVILGTLRYVHHCRALVFSPFPPFFTKYLKDAWYLPSPLGESVKVKGI